MLSVPGLLEASGVSGVRGITFLRVFVLLPARDPGTTGEATEACLPYPTGQTPA